MEQIGLPAEMIADMAAAGESAGKGFEVWPDNMPIVDAFLSVATQWRTAALADGRVLWFGLDYTAVRARLDTVSPSCWRGLATMERAAASVLNGGRG